MGQLDDEYRAYKKHTTENDNSLLEPAYRDSFIEYDASRYATSGITDRSQIINPYEILSGYHFGNSRKERAKYDEYLGMLQNIQGQQQASYDEWYNSPEQQNIRDRQAGLNPDLAGLSDTQAPQTQTSDISPYEGIPTNGEVFTSAVGSIASIVGAVASVASLPGTFSAARLANAQAESSVLANLSSFEKLAGIEIASRLSDSIASAVSAGQSLDINEWFGHEPNFENIFESYSPNDSSLYRNSFANVRRRMQKNLGSAYENGKVTAENQSSFAGLVSSGRYSADVLQQIALTRPVMVAKEALEVETIALERVLAKYETSRTEGLDVQSAIDAANSKNEYDSDYYSTLDGEFFAEVENYAKKLQKFKIQIEQTTKRNYWDIYKQNPYSDEGLAAAYILNSDGNMSLSDLFWTNAANDFRQMLKDQGLYEHFKRVYQEEQARLAEIQTDNADFWNPYDKTKNIFSAFCAFIFDLGGKISNLVDGFIPG